MTQKLCRICKETLDATRFSVDRRLTGGLRHECKACCSAKHRAYYEAHRDSRLKQMQVYNDQKKHLGEFFAGYAGLHLMTDQAAKIVLKQRRRRSPKALKGKRERACVRCLRLFRVRSLRGSICKECLDREKDSAREFGAKICICCNKTLSLIHFYRSAKNPDGLNSRCKECLKENNRTRFRSAREKDKERERYQQQKIRRLCLKYGITEAYYLAMLESQDEKCAICKTYLASPCVDHDHGTGKVRGLLCKPCNTMLGHAFDKSEILRSGAAYLQKHKSSRLHTA